MNMDNVRALNVSQPVNSIFPQGKISSTQDSETHDSVEINGEESPEKNNNNLTRHFIEGLVISRQSKPDDWKILGFVDSLSKTLQDKGMSHMSRDAVLQMMDEIRTSCTADNSITVLKHYFGEETWTSPTYVKVIQLLKSAASESVKLPGSGGIDRKVLALHTIGTLIPQKETQNLTDEELKNTRLEGLKNLGYNEAISSRIVECYPKLADDILLWGKVSLEKAGPRNLYRSLSLEGGWSSYDPTRVGDRNGEMYFDDNYSIASNFGKDNDKTHVVMETQIPGFMIEQSPPQGWDTSYPILRTRNMPEPEHPDIRPFISKLGTAEPGSENLIWKEYI